MIPAIKANTGSNESTAQGKIDVNENQGSEETVHISDNWNLHDYVVTFHRSRVQVTAPSMNYQTLQIPLNLIEHFVKGLGLGETFNAIHLSVSWWPVLRPVEKWPVFYTSRFFSLLFFKHTGIIKLLWVIFSFLFAEFDLVMKHCLKLDTRVSFIKNVAPTFESPENYVRQTKHLHDFDIFMHHHVLVL